MPCQCCNCRACCSRLATLAYVFLGLSATLTCVSFAVVDLIGFGAEGDSDGPLFLFFQVSGLSFVQIEIRNLMYCEPVSYTHLTLPTKA